MYFIQSIRHRHILFSLRSSAFTMKSSVMMRVKVCLATFALLHCTPPVLAQLTPKSDNVCVYSFTVPRHESTPDGAAGCASDPSSAAQLQAELNNLKASDNNLRTTLRALQEQMAALMTTMAAQTTHISTLSQDRQTQQDEISTLRARIASQGTRDAASVKPEDRKSAGDGSDTAFITGGVTYIRWGRTVCPAGADILYKGFAAGSHYTHSGDGSNYLCLSEEPQWGNHTDAASGLSYIYGVEYEFNDMPFSTENNGGRNLLDHDAPCVACHVPTRSSMIMIPAWLNCSAGWNKEYSGYLVSHHHQQRKSEYVCLDAAPEVVAGGSVGRDGALFYPVEAVCGALTCPKYVNFWQLACVVCTK